MLYLNGIKENLETLAVIARTCQPETKIQSFSSIKKGLRSYLLKFQPKSIILSEEADKIIEIKDSMQIEAFRDLFGERSKLNDLKQESLIDANSSWDHKQLSSTKFIEAMDFINNKDPFVFQYINLLFNYFFFAESTKAAGGSTSGGIGVLWVNPKKSWTTQDYCEFIIHEMTHQILFYDERRFEHYPEYEKMSKSENFAYSTILNKSRPLDKVIHSLFVGINVLLFRELFFGLDSCPTLHPSSDSIIRSLAKTFESIEQLNSELFSPRLKSLLKQAKLKHQELNKKEALYYECTI